MTQRSQACSGGKGAHCQLQGPEWGFWVPHRKRRKPTPAVCPLNSTGAQWYICPHKINNTLINPNPPKQQNKHTHIHRYTPFSPPPPHLQQIFYTLSCLFCPMSIFSRLGNCFRLENSCLRKYVEEGWSWGHMGLDKTSPWLGRLAQLLVAGCLKKPTRQKTRR